MQTESEFKADVAAEMFFQETKDEIWFTPGIREAYMADNADWLEELWQDYKRQALAEAEQDARGLMEEIGEE